MYGRWFLSWDLSPRLWRMPASWMWCSDVMSDTTLGFGGKASAKPWASSTQGQQQDQRKVRQVVQQPWCRWRAVMVFQSGQEHQALLLQAPCSIWRKHCHNSCMFEDVGSYPRRSSLCFSFFFFFFSGISAYQRGQGYVEITHVGKSQPRMKRTAAKRHWSHLISGCQVIGLVSILTLRCATEPSL